MKLSSADIKSYQKQLNKNLSSGDIIDHQVLNLSLSSEEIDDLPSYDKRVYKEALMMKRHLDIQQKIHYKTKLKKFTNSDVKEDHEDHDIVSGELSNDLFKKLREYREMEGKFNFKSYLKELSSVKIAVKNEII